MAENPPRKSPLFRLWRNEKAPRQSVVIKPPFLLRKNGKKPQKKVAAKQPIFKK